MSTRRLNRVLTITTAVVFLVLFLGVPLQAMAQWHWGVEECREGKYPQDYPQGQAGAFFFQFGNEWADGKSVKFEGWNKARNLQRAWCFLGSITTILLYHEWPKESHFSGVWGKEKVMIDHMWNYDEIKDPVIDDIENWYQDDPEKREINGCPITGYCTAADEIRRLYGAVKLALGLGGDGGYGCVFDSEKYSTCIPDSLEKYFGYQLDVIVPSVLPNEEKVRLSLEDEKKLINSLNNKYPIIVVGDGHVWVVDDYRDTNGGEFHILNYGCPTSHQSYWIHDLINDGHLYNARAYIYNIRPKTTQKDLEAVFHANINRGNAPLTVQFTDKSMGDITSWLWNFGDGVSSTERHPHHTFQSEGRFTVSLTVANESGADTVTKEGFIIVDPKSPQMPDWEEGDVFVGGAGVIQIFDNSGVFKERLDIPHLGLPTCGYNHVADELYIVDFDNDKAFIYNGTNPHNLLRVVHTGCVSDADCLRSKGPVFAANKDFYVGHREGRRPILLTTPHVEYQVQTESGGADFLSLSADQRTMYYTSRGERIMRYDVVNRVQLLDFTNVPGSISQNLVLLPPDGEGGLLVAQLSDIKRIDRNGNIVQIYDIPNVDGWARIALDPNGTSFWALNVARDDFYRFNIQTGHTEVGPIDTQLSFPTALCVKGEPIVSLPQKQLFFRSSKVVNFIIMDTDYDSTPLKPPLEAGTYIITALLLNISDNIAVYAPIKAIVSNLGYVDRSTPHNSIQLISATEGDGARGSKQRIKLGPRDILRPYEFAMVQFHIGLQHRSKFRFFVVVEGFPSEAASH